MKSSSTDGTLRPSRPRRRSISCAISLLDIETALRAAASQTYLVANSTTAGFQIVFDTPSWHAALADAGLTVEQNWAALARRK